CRAARAAPEGYTVSIGNTSAVYPVQYEVLKDFEAVSLLTNGPSCAAVSTWPSSRLPCAILLWPDALARAGGRFRTIQVLPKAVASALREAERAVNRLTAARRGWRTR